MIASLLALLRAYPEQATIIVHLASGRELSFPISPNPPSSNGAPPVEKALTRTLRDAGCVGKAGSRMLLAAILSDFQERGVDVSQRTVERHLARMQEEKKVLHEKGRGFYLPDQPANEPANCEH